MLPQHRRVSPRERVAQILKKGTSLRGSSFFAKYLARNPLIQPPLCRFAVIASTKVSKRAVDRNLIRRRVSEAIRKNIHDDHTSCYDVVVILTQRALSVRYRALEIDVVNTLKRFL